MSAPEKPIRVLIVDDHPVVRAGLASMLTMRSEIEVVAAVSECSQALEVVRHHPVDVILLDLRLPGMDGLSFLRLSAARRGTARVLVLTSYERAEEIFRVVQAGAQGYLTKDAGEQEMASAIRQVHRGGRVLPPHIAARLAERMQRSELTARELEILRELAGGLTNRAIGAKLGISENTVRNHMNSLLSKLAVADRTEAVALALRQGIIELDPAVHPRLR